MPIKKIGFVPRRSRGQTDRLCQLLISMGEELTIFHVVRIEPCDALVQNLQVKDQFHVAHEIGQHTDPRQNPEVLQDKKPLKYHINSTSMIRWYWRTEIWLPSWGSSRWKRHLGKRLSAEDKSIVSGMFHSYLAPLLIAVGLSTLFVLGTTLLTIAVSISSLITGIVWFGWACFARKEIFEED